MISHFFIRRPVFATVLAMVIVLAGVMAVRGLPVDQYPEITPPTVQVAANYPGASAEVVAQTVGQPIEQLVNGVEDMIYMSSTCTNNGSYGLTVTFDVGTDLDLAAVRVQNLVSAAEPLLPEEVVRLGVTTTKQSTSFLQILQLVSPDNRFDTLYLSNYATLRMVDELRRVPGVGAVNVVGGSPFGMRLWLDPAKMQARNLTTDDILRALREQNVQVAAGQIGQPPAPDGQPKQLTITTLGRLSNVGQFEDIIIKTGDGVGGQLVHLRDVARVELGAQNYDAASTLNGQPCISILIYQRPGANALSAAAAVRTALEKLSKSFPEGIEYRLAFDTTTYVNAAIHEVILTLLTVVLLVFLTVYLFLQDMRTTLIPAITIPVSIIGAFAVMSVFGFSINMLTLFGLVLAIGIVVDDAIIVVENVARKMEDEELSGREAAFKAMNEVTGPVIATTLVLLAVFVPASFIAGVSGQLYRQFALTIAGSTVISTINALTLSPALCGVLLRRHRPHNWLPFRIFNFVFKEGTLLYTLTVRASLRRVWIMAVLFVVIMAATAFQFLKLPTGFLPTDDQGFAIVFGQLPSGASLQRTEAVGQQISKIALDTPGVRDAIVINGLSLFDGAIVPNAVTAFLPLKAWDERRDPRQSLFGIIGAMNGAFSQIPEARIFAFPPPSIRGVGISGGFEVQVQDRGGAGIQDLQKYTYDLVAQANAQPNLSQVNTTFTADVPQLYADIDRTKAKAMRVPLSNIFNTLQTFLGSSYVNDFNLFGRVYQVKAQADAPFRATREDIAQLRVRNEDGDMVPLGSLLRVEETVGPQVLRRFNVYPSATVTGQAAPGYSSGEAMDTIEQLARSILPENMGIEWSGISYQERKATSEAPLILALALVVVFLVLAAQYESWGTPLSIILSVPLALVGAVIAVMVMGTGNNTYTQIGLVLLIALASKNAILIVEFARTKRASGMGLIEAAVEASRLRLRAILMTSLSFVLGTYPLVVATGAGAASRRAIGTAVFGGMIAATFLNVVFVPAFFVLIQGLTEWFSRKFFSHHTEIHDSPTGMEAAE